MVCPRCGKSKFNTLTICRYKNRVPVNKCLICGFIWIEDSNLKLLAKDISKKMFINELRNLGKNDQRENGS